MKPSNIVQLREKLGLTQSEFGKTLGVHPMTVSRWERGTAFPEGATAQLLEAMCLKTKRKSPPPNIGDLVKTALVGAAVGAALVVLLRALFGKK